MRKWIVKKAHYIAELISYLSVKADNLAIKTEQGLCKHHWYNDTYGRCCSKCYYVEWSNENGVE